MTAAPPALDQLSAEQKRALLLGLLARDGAAAPAPPARVPLSSGQRGLWFLQELSPDSAAYNLAWPARLDAALDAGALRRATLALMARHPALRTVVIDDEQALWQETPARWDHLLAFAEHDASEESDDELAERVAACYRRPFDLRRGPTLRLDLFRQGAERHVLLLVMHHIFADAWSLQVMLRDLGELYTEELGGGAARLPALAWTPADHVAWQQAILEGAERSGLWARWRERLAAPLPVLELPPPSLPAPAASPPSSPLATGVSATFTLDAELGAAVKQLARSRGCTVFVVLLSAFYTLLHRLTRATDLLIGSPMAGRERQELAELVGYFVNLVPLRVRLEAVLPFGELLERVRHAVLSAMDDQALPFDALVERLAPERDARRTPLVEVLFEYRQPSRDGELLWLTVSEDSAARVDFGGLTSVGRYPLRQQEGKFALQLEMADLGAELAGVWKFRPEAIDSDTVARMTEQLRTLLRSATAAPERPIGALELLSAEERARLLALGRPRRVIAATPPLHQWFAEVAARHPEELALIDGVETMRYRELDERSSRVARQLRARGVAAGELVGLCVQRSFDIVVGELAILKAGAAFVPLDPALPPERLELYARDAELRHLLCHGETAALVASLPVVASGEAALLSLSSLVALPEDGAAATARDAALPLPEDAPAYVIYTSGSTGKPKGVVVTHRNVARLFRATEEDFAFSASDVWTLFHSYAFDFSIWEIWGALLYGGRLVIVPAPASRSPELFHALLRAEGITVLSQTPSAFQELAQLDALVPAPSLPALRVVVFGGEALAPGALERWMDRHGDEAPRLINMYGITETCVHVTFRPVTRRDLARPSASPIGRPIDDLGLYLLDEHLAPVPVGVAGELYVGGDGLALGYLRRPGLTAERFVPDPFDGRPGRRLYRSGDLARRSPQTEELEYLGRIDSQVKIRGFRIELGEIEHALRAHPGVRDVVVLPAGLAQAEHLLAYVVPRREARAISDDVLARELLASAAAKLPPYMVPAAVLMIDALPLNHNGKIDRGALPRWERAAAAAGSDEAAAAEEAPETETERALAAIWAALLGVAQVSRRARFFHIGGHSLLATRMILRVRQELGAEIPILAVFETPELAELAARIDGLKRAASPELPSAPEAPLERADRSGELPLGLAQQRLWFLDRLDPGNPVYNVPVMYRLRGPLDRGALAAALARLEERHEILRTSYPLAASGQPVQRIAPAPALALEVRSLRHLAEEEREAEAQRLATAFFHRPFELERAAPWRGALLELGDDHHWLVLCAHHLALDGWSVDVLVSELVELLRASAAGEPARLPEPAAQYADFAQWQRRWQTPEHLAAELAHWRRQLDGAPLVLELPGDHPRPPVQTFRGGLLPFARRRSRRARCASWRWPTAPPPSWCCSPRCRPGSTG